MKPLILILFGTLTASLSILYPLLTASPDSFFCILFPQKRLKEKEVIKLKRDYLLFSILLDGWNLCFLLALFAVYGQSIVQFLCALLFPILVALIGSRAFHIKFLQLKLRKKWDDELRNEEIPKNPQKVFSYKWFAVYAGMILAVWLITAMMYRQLPETLPLRFDRTGNAVASVVKNGFSLFSVPFACLVLGLFFVWLTVSMGKKRAEKTYTVYLLRCFLFCTGVDVMANLLVSQLALMQLLDFETAFYCSLGGVMVIAYAIVVLLKKFRNVNR